MGVQNHLSIGVPVPDPSTASSEYVQLFSVSFVLTLPCFLTGRTRGPWGPWCTWNARTSGMTLPIVLSVPPVGVVWLYE